MVAVEIEFSGEPEREVLAQGGLVDPAEHLKNQVFSKTGDFGRGHGVPI